MNDILYSIFGILIPFLGTSLGSFFVFFLREKMNEKLQNGTQKKWIDGLAELLDKAEKKDSIAESKIKKLRDCFGIQKQDTAQCDELDSSTATVTFAEESE